VATKGKETMDIVFLLITLVLFAAAYGFVESVERL
jgi:hypothetical protein